MKEHYIELFRKHGFNCFPIPHNSKVADHRYKASKTKENQDITDQENFGIIPTLSGHNCIIDLDDKERYREFAELVVKDGYMVIETPHGFHVPVVGLTGQVSKVELYDYNIQQKKIIEIQGVNHYIVGAESVVFDDDLGKHVTYTNVGTEKIWDVKGKDFHELIDQICKYCHVTSSKKATSTLHNIRLRFKKGIPPSKGTSNDYFFQAALVCNTDGIKQEDAIEKLRIVYDAWALLSHYSNRPFSNIEAKIRDVYENNYKISTGRPKASDDFDRTTIAEQLLHERKIYSDSESHELFENRNGFLEKINNTLHKDLQIIYHSMENSDFDAIKFRIEGLADDIPPTNKKLIVFNNGVYNIDKKQLVKTDEIADLGFKDYDYLEKSKENEPTKFIQVMFANIPDNEHPRVKAALKSTISNFLDPRISVTHGASGVGKSTGLVILVEILNKREDYALTVELSQILDDKFIKAKTKGKRLLVLQDLPTTYRDFSMLKAMTGEMMKTERGFHQDSVTFENKLKIWGTGNYLAVIPENEKNAMYSRRLSLIHNQRELPYPENPEFVDQVVEQEGEKIISWILNIPDSECQYESPNTVRKEWESLASPEIEYLENHYDIKTELEDSAISVMRIKRDFEEKYQQVISLKQMTDALQSLGYVVVKNIIKNIEDKPVPNMPREQKRI